MFKISLVKPHCELVKIFLTYKKKSHSSTFSPSFQIGPLLRLIGSCQDRRNKQKKTRLKLKSPCLNLGAFRKAKALPSNSLAQCRVGLINNIHPIRDDPSFRKVSNNFPVLLSFRVLFGLFYFFLVAIRTCFASKPIAQSLQEQFPLPIARTSNSDQQFTSLGNSLILFSTEWPTEKHCIFVVPNSMNLSIFTKTKTRHNIRLIKAVHSSKE